eukprot:TRINITY_DN17960_c0_g1_i1.p1 TRINITY_DN17960_c0_g1~~TRINITY_DN17960_c0_g1_i1.p1  ORF type:complete len:433 (+),score=78.00 TRINITY_DN17960_c0_g1_i1:91-1389(+)
MPGKRTSVKSSNIEPKRQKGIDDFRSNLVDINEMVAPDLLIQMFSALSIEDLYFNVRLVNKLWEQLARRSLSTRTEFCISHSNWPPQQLSVLIKACGTHLSSLVLFTPSQLSNPLFLGRQTYLFILDSCPHLETFAFAMHVQTFWSLPSERQTLESKTIRHFTLHVDRGTNFKFNLPNLLSLSLVGLSAEALRSILFRLGYPHRACPLLQSIELHHNNFSEAVFTFSGSLRFFTLIAPSHETNRSSRARDPKIEFQGERPQRMEKLMLENLSLFTCAQYLNVMDNLESATLSHTKTSQRSGSVPIIQSSLTSLRLNAVTLHDEVLKFPSLRELCISDATKPNTLIRMEPTTTLRKLEILNTSTIDGLHLVPSMFPHISHLDLGMLRVKASDLKELTSKLSSLRFLKCKLGDDKMRKIIEAQSANQTLKITTW